MRNRFADEIALLPEPVRMATERVEQAGFTTSCNPGLGRLFTVSAAAVPVQGRALDQNSLISL